QCHRTRDGAGGERQTNGIQIGEIKDHACPYSRLRLSRACQAASGSLLFSLPLRPALVLRRRADRRRRLALLGLALDADLAQLGRLEVAPLDQLLDQRLVLLLVLVRQRVLVGAQADDDVFLARRRVAAQANGHFGHANTPPRRKRLLLRALRLVLHP